MHVHIAPSVGSVSVDGVTRYGFDMSSLTPDISAIDWVDNEGVVQYKDITQPKNRLVIIKDEIITDFSLYQHFVDAWIIKDQQMKAGA